MSSRTLCAALALTALLGLGLRVVGMIPDFGIARLSSVKNSSAASRPLPDEPNPFVRPRQAKSFAREVSGPVRGRGQIASPLSGNLAQDLKILGELHATPEARQIFNAPGRDPHQLVSMLKSNPAMLSRSVRIARRFSSVAAECLGIDLCDQRPKSGYFDPYDTRLHVMMNQSLEFLIAARDDAGVRNGLPERDELLRNFKVHNGETQLLSMELLMSGPPSDELREELMAQGPECPKRGQAHFSGHACRRQRGLTDR